MQRAIVFRRIPHRAGPGRNRKGWSGAVGNHDRQPGWAVVAGRRSAERGPPTEVVREPARRGGTSRPRCRGSSRRHFPAITGSPGTGAISRPPSFPAEPARCLLRFWAVDYKADVWLNGVAVGSHEGGETPFVIDVSKAIRPGQKNRLTVRVLNPTHQAIDGIVLNETPHRNKVIPYGPGSAWDHGRDHGFRGVAGDAARSASPTCACGPTGRRA